MKTALKIILVVLLILIAVVFVNTNLNRSLTTTEVTVMRDITDNHISQPKLADIVYLLNFNDSIWNGASFRFVDITDVSYNHTYETSINAENKWMGNEFDRQKKVKQFYSEIIKILTNAEAETDGRANSSVYIPIAIELNRLSQSTATKRVLLIYSDLTENTAELSLYKKDNSMLMKTNPDSIRKYFESETPLKNLEGIKVYLIYQPTNRETDEKYKLIAGFYKNLFESKGATVEITANVN